MQGRWERRRSGYERAGPPGSRQKRSGVGGRGSGVRQPSEGPRGPAPPAPSVCSRAGPSQPPAANPGGRPGRGGACRLRLRASSFLHTHEYKEPYDLRVSFFHFSPSLILCVCSKFLKIDICGSVGVRKLAKGDLRFPPFLFCLSYPFFFLVKVLNIPRSWEAGCSCTTVSSRIYRDFFFLFAITF